MCTFIPRDAIRTAYSVEITCYNKVHFVAFGAEIHIKDVCANVS